MLFTIGLAFITALIGPFLVGLMWRKLRDDAFERHKGGEPDIPLATFAYAFLERKLIGIEEAVRKHGSDLRDPIQRGAREAQDKYHEMLARGVGAIAIAFVVLSASLTWAPGASEFSAALDVACLLVTIYAFWRAAYYNQIWLRRRAKNELIRQWCVLDNLLVMPPARAAAPADAEADVVGAARRAAEALTAAKNDVEADYAGVKRRVEAIVRPEELRFFRSIGALVLGALKRVGSALQGKELDLDAGFSKPILEFWKETRRPEIEKALSGGLTADRIAVHFKKRPWTQANWFPRAGRRLREHGAWRGGALLVAFFLTLMVCLIKLAVVLHIAPHEWVGAKPALSFSILVLIGCSAAISALYLNQNNRSLVHRYDAQERAIDAWFAQYRPVLAEVDKAASANAAIANDLADRIVQAVLTFEDLMIDEMLDFIAISEHDTMELAPA